MKPQRFTLKAKNRHSTKKGQQVGFGNHGMSDEGVRSYKKALEALKKESKEELLGQAMAWDTYAKENGYDMEYRFKQTKEVRIR